MVERITVGDFEIVEQPHESLTVWCIYDRDQFNNWGERNDIYDKQCAIDWATWATAFKQGRTFRTFLDWRRIREEVLA